MLFMTIFTYEPTRRDEVINRAVSSGTQTPEGAREVGIWSDVAGGRVFRLLETEDPKVMYRGTYAWSDLGKVEVVPVLETGELLGMLANL